MGAVFRIKRRYAEDGLEGVFNDRPQANRYRKLGERGEAHLIAPGLQLSTPSWDMSAGPCACWPVKWVELGLTTSMSYEGVRLHLKETPSNRGRSRSGASLR